MLLSYYVSSANVFIDGLNRLKKAFGHTKYDYFGTLVGKCFNMFNNMYNHDKIPLSVYYHEFQITFSFPFDKVKSLVLNILLKNNTHPYMQTHVFICNPVMISRDFMY